MERPLYNEQHDYRIIALNKFKADIYGDALVDLMKGKPPQDIVFNGQTLINVQNDEKQLGKLDRYSVEVAGKTRPHLTRHEASFVASQFQRYQSQARLNTVKFSYQQGCSMAKDHGLDWYHKTKEILADQIGLHHKEQVEQAEYKFRESATYYGLGEQKTNLALTILKISKPE